MKKEKVSGFEKYFIDTLNKDIESRTLFLKFYYEQPLTTQGALLRKYKGLSQIMLAKRAKLTQPKIARFERPGANPRMKTLQKIASALEIMPVMVPKLLIPEIIKKETLSQGESYFNKIVYGRR